MTVLCIVLLGALCAKFGVPVWLVLVLGVLLTAVSAEIRDSRREIRKEEIAGTVPAQDNNFATTGIKRAA